MKKALFLIILSALYCTTFINAQKLTVASYNIRNDNKSDAERGDGWQQRCPVVCDLVRFHDFQIFGMQEARNSQINEMLALLPEYDYIGVGRDDGAKKGEYSPIFYKKDQFELLRAGDFWLSETPGVIGSKGWDAALPRICTWGEFKDKNTGFTFWFFNLHMDHRGKEARRQSAKLVLDKIKEMCGDSPVILTGDFNVDQTHESYKLLANSDILKDSYENAAIRYATTGTFNSFNPNLKTDSRIDHIFVSHPIKVERYGVLTDTYRSVIGDGEKVDARDFPEEVSLQKYRARVPSDHFPVKVILAY